MIQLIGDSNRKYLKQVRKVSKACRRAARKDKRLDRHDYNENGHWIKPFELKILTLGFAKRQADQAAYEELKKAA
jgi:hypothetical protein